MTEFLGEYELPFETILIKVQELDYARNPNLRDRRELIIRETKETKKTATYWTIVNEHTNQIRHHSLTLKTISHTKKNGWVNKSQHSITLTDEDEFDDLKKLVAFMSSVGDLNTDGNYLIIDPEKLSQGIPRVLRTISNNKDNLNLLSQILDWANTDETANRGLIDLASQNPTRSKSLVAALNYGRYSQALNKLKNMVESDLPERTYQKFLEENYWMFGSEYSELISKRTLVLGDQLDFPLRRTVDGYLDVIEIKLPIGADEVISWDNSHQNNFMGRELSKAVGQVKSYLRNLNSEHQRIELINELKVEKVRGRIIIGRDGNKDQMDFLRDLNRDDNSIQIMTYDQLIRVGERILEIMAEENSLNVPDKREQQYLEPPSTVDDIPF